MVFDLIEKNDLVKLKYCFKSIRYCDSFILIIEFRFD